MKSKTVGELLQLERARCGLSLAELAVQTKIKLERLQDLEADQLSNLPAAPFVKGYLRSCARVLGVESESLIAVLRRDYKESIQGQLVLRDHSQPMNAKWWSGRTFSWQAVVFAGLILALILYGLLQWYQLTRPPSLVVSEPDDQAVVANNIVVKGYTDPEMLLTVNQLPVALDADGFFQTTLDFADEGLALITVEAFDEQGRSTRIDKTVFVEF